MTQTDPPLSADETEELKKLLEEAGSPSLPFARGVMSAVATAPSSIPTTEWLPLVLGDSVPDRPTLRRLMSLLRREAQACATCLQLGVPVVPPLDDAQKVTDFCRGYVQLAQRDSVWTRDAEAFELTLPLAAIAGYVSADSLHDVAPEATQDSDRYRQEQVQALPDTLAALYQHTEAKRSQSRREETGFAGEKIGRNEACPCGSGKKYKKCCGLQ